MKINTAQIDFVERILALLTSRQHLNYELKTQLSEKIDELGVTGFIRDVATPLGVLVGERWQKNQTPIFIEHVYASQMRDVLNDLIIHNETIYQVGTPKILLCTVTGEQHTLGNAMVQALLSNKKAFCLNLGGELPVSEVIHAANYYQMNVVGISFSVVFNKRMMTSMVAKLRDNLPSSTELWLGGSGVQHHDHLAPRPNMKVLTDVDAILSAYDHTQKTLQNSIPAFDVHAPNHL